MAATVNIAAIFFPYIAPIVGLVVSPKMPFVRYHAARSLIEQLLASIVIGILLLASLLYSAWSIKNTMADGFDISKIDWVTLLIKTAVTWVLMTIWGAINTILNVRDAIDALHGKLPTKPKWTDRKAFKIAGMSALGTSQNLGHL